MSDELSPVFRLRVWFDGDDDPATQTGNVRFELQQKLEALQADGLVRWYELDLDDPDGENPAYGPGNPDWERDMEKTR